MIHIIVGGARHPRAAPREPGGRRRGAPGESTYAYIYIYILRNNRVHQL